MKEEKKEKSKQRMMMITIVIIAMNIFSYAMKWGIMCQEMAEGIIIEVVLLGTLLATTMPWEIPRKK